MVKWNYNDHILQRQNCDNFVFGNNLFSSKSEVIYYIYTYTIKYKMAVYLKVQYIQKYEKLTI